MGGKILKTSSKMSNQSHLRSHPHGTEPGKPNGRKLHRDWRVWLGVILMLIAMAAYVLTMDEAIVPGAASAGNPASTNAPAAP
jgi:hypothetical protein